VIAHLAGGVTGNYTVRVQKSDMGNSMNDKPFSYQFTVSNVSPSSGSKNGGQLVTVTGTNFLTDTTSNNVYVHFEDAIENIDILCTVVSSTTTSLVFIAPPFDTRFTGPVQIIIQAKLQEENLCTGTCTYTYDDTKTGTLNVSSTAVTTFNTGSPYTFSGTKFS
jgi:hypothetical protein